LEICGLQVNFEQVQGLLCEVARIFGFWNHFPMVKGGGPRGVPNPWYHRALHSDRWQGSPELSLTAALGYGGLP
jgi:hypothetical protein